MYIFILLNLISLPLINSQEAFVSNINESNIANNYYNPPNNAIAKETQTIYIATPIYVTTPSGNEDYLKILNPDLNMNYPNGIYYKNKIKDIGKVAAAKVIQSATPTNKEVVGTNLPRVDVDKLPELIQTIQNNFNQTK